MSCRAWLCGVIAVAGADAVQAQGNLLANPGFDADLAGWTVQFDRPAEWDVEDRLAAPGSGSARLGHGEPSNGGYANVLSQCVPVTAHGPYLFGAWMRNPAGQPLAGSAIVFLQQHTNGTCSAVSSNQNTGIATGTSWALRESFAEIFTSTNSVRVSLAVGKPAGTNELHEALFDDVFLVPYDPIFADGFDPVP